MASNVNGLTKESLNLLYVAEQEDYGDVGLEICQQSTAHDFVSHLIRNGKFKESEVQMLRQAANLAAYVNGSPVNYPSQMLLMMAKAVQATSDLSLPTNPNFK